MEKIILITGGCSFSEIPSHPGEFVGRVETWPFHLQNYMECDHISTGLSSQGNGLISRKLIYQIEKLAQTQRYEDMLVGIMWSGNTRSEIYKKNGIQIGEKLNDDYSIATNPTTVSQNNSWYIVNPWWSGYPYVKEYYGLIDMDQLIIMSYEHIVRTQDFLKLRGIKYFMTTITSEVLYKGDLFPEIEHLYNAIDFENWLPIDGCYEWCRDNTNIAFPLGSYHPSEVQHKMFTEQVIVPFLKEKNYV